MTRDFFKVSFQPTFCPAVADDSRNAPRMLRIYCLSTEVPPFVVRLHCDVCSLCRREKKYTTRTRRYDDYGKSVVPANIPRYYVGGRRTILEKHFHTHIETRRKNIKKVCWWKRRKNFACAPGKEDSYGFYAFLYGAVKMENARGESVMCRRELVEKRALDCTF